MQTISSISKLLGIVFSITCSVFFLWHYGKPIDTLVTDFSRDVSFFYQTVEDTSPRSDFIPAFALPKIHVFKKHQITQKPTLIWADIGQHLNLDHHVQDPRVQKEIRHILSDKTSFEKDLARSGPYIFYIYTQTQQRHLPAELTLIPIIESEYTPTDHNSIGAMGLWQLMPGTARGLGVKMGDGYDGRLNVIQSTNAALTFYQDLGHEFHGNWNLAIAAYNCGPGGVASAMRRANSNDFFKLQLPLETKIYVPRLLAIAEIVKHPKKYGIVLPNISNTPYFTEVKINKSQSLTSYAKSINTDVTTLTKLNPDYRYKSMLVSSNTFLVPVKK